MALTKRTDKLKFLEGLKDGTRSLDELEGGGVFVANPTNVS